METWEHILIGLAALAVVFLIWPAAKRAMERSREVENPDWKAALIPIGFVILFVIFLIVMSRA